jgi:uncharacterized protein YdhG (YjbR/CyaY superfamily)
MAFSNFNPPFTNKTLDDFFDYESDQRADVLFLKDWIENEFPELTLALAYHVPFYSYRGKKLLYFHYLKNDDTKELEFEISFVK